MKSNQGREGDVEVEEMFSDNTWSVGSDPTNTSNATTQEPKKIAPVLNIHLYDITI